MISIDNENNFEQFYRDKINVVKVVNNELLADCPFCGKEEHFYANIPTGQYQCKKCDKSGNARTYLREFEKKDDTQILECFVSYGINEEVDYSASLTSPMQYFEQSLVDYCVANITEEQLLALSVNRGLPVDILKKYQVGMNNQSYFTLPVYDQEGKIRDIRRKKIGEDTISSSGASVFLFGIKDLLSSNRIFLTEGEWSKMALEVQGYASVGVPGANTFKNEWTQFFKNKEVYIVFDTDDAGRDGAAKVVERLQNVVKQLKIIHLPKELGDGKDVRNFFNEGGNYDQFEVLIKSAEPAGETMPLSLPNFMKLDIPPVEFHISDILPKRGKSMISGFKGVTKSLFIQNMSVAMTSGTEFLPNKFSVSSARVLYLDLEMGPSPVKERFEKMTMVDNLNCENLYIKCLPSTDLLNKDNRLQLEKWLAALKIDVLILDPLGSAWIGNENDQKEVSQLTSYLNSLIYKFGISIVIVHHWRKSTKDNSSGGQMAAGSYRWEAWLDCHITLEGPATNIIISCEKNRHRPAFKSFQAKLNETTLWIEFLADFKDKADESILVTLFDSFSFEKVAIPELVKMAEKMKLCSETTLRKLIDKTKLFYVDDTKKTHYLIKVKGLER